MLVRSCVCVFVSSDQKTDKIYASIAEKGDTGPCVKRRTGVGELTDVSLIHWAVRICQSACRYANAPWQGADERNRLARILIITTSQTSPEGTHFRDIFSPVSKAEIGFGFIRTADDTYIFFELGIHWFITSLQLFLQVRR